MDGADGPSGTGTYIGARLANGKAKIGRERHVRGQFFERKKNEVALPEPWMWDTEAWLIDHSLTKQDYVEIDRSRFPARRGAPTTERVLDTDEDVEQLGRFTGRAHLYDGVQKGRLRRCSFENECIRLVDARHAPDLDVRSNGERRYRRLEVGPAIAEIASNTDQDTLGRHRSSWTQQDSRSVLVGQDRR
jgi:hypothetical protein